MLDTDYSDNDNNLGDDPSINEKKNINKITNNNVEEEEDKYEANLIKELKVKGKPNKRSSSIKIYKNKKKQKKYENNSSSRNNSCVELKDIDEDNINNNSENKSKKKVNFDHPNFLEIINIESYKKYNSENMWKDPFDGVTDINSLQFPIEDDELINRKECCCIIF